MNFEKDDKSCMYLSPDLNEDESWNQDDWHSKIK